MNCLVTELDAEKPISLLETVNFEFLREKHPDLAEWAGFAERYVHTDPASAMVKLRSFAENLVDKIYLLHCFTRPDRPNFLELLTLSDFEQAIPPVILSILHRIRTQGNRGAHGDQPSPESAQQLVREAHQIARWYVL